MAKNKEQEWITIGTRIKKEDYVYFDDYCKWNNRKKSDVLGELFYDWLAGVKIRLYGEQTDEEPKEFNPDIKYATESQKNYIHLLCRQNNTEAPEDIDTMTISDADKLIKKLKGVEVK